MERKGLIKPDVINNLCGAPRRHVQQRAEYEPAPTPVSETKPEKKGFWNRVNRFFKKAAKVVSAIAAAIISVAAVIKAATSYRKAMTSYKKASLEFATVGV